MNQKILNTSEKIKDYHMIDPEKDVAILELIKGEVHYDKPIAIGATILDLSKYYMQRFYYHVLKPFYGGCMKFLYTDTDSIIAHLFQDGEFSPRYQRSEISSSFRIERDRESSWIHENREIWPCSLPSSLPETLLLREI
jgi:hypothetical protein